MAPLIDPPTASPEELLDRLRRSGYCCCSTEFGCAACVGKKD